MPRYMMIAVLLTIIGIAVIGKALYIMTAKKQYWTEVADRLKRDSVSVKPNRGNILSCDGQLMATSIPEYKIFIDFQAAAFAKDDSLWLDKVDSLCEGLSKICPPTTAAEYRKHLAEGWKSQSRYFEVCKHKTLNYIQYKELMALPFCCRRTNWKIYW